MDHGRGHWAFETHLGLQCNSCTTSLALASSSQIYLPGKRCTKVLKPGDSVTVSSIIFHVDDCYVNIIMWGHGTGFTLSLSALPGP